MFGRILRKFCVCLVLCAVLLGGTGCSLLFRSFENLQDVLPSSAPDSYFVSGKNYGYCETLTGDVYILFVWVDDALSAWDESAKTDLMHSMSEELDRLEQQAEVYGVELSFAEAHVDTEIDVEATDFDDAWKDAAIKNMGYGDSSLDSAQRRLEQDKNVESAPIIFLINRNGRAYAVSQTYGDGEESVVLYASEEGALTHELLHLYGAEDYYLNDELAEIAERHFPGSIMNEGETIDELTRYLVGWSDGLSDNIRSFFDATSHMTEEYLESVREQDQFTGTSEIEWSGGIYKGELVSGVPHGKGVLTFEDGSYYDGEWEGGYYHGYGVYDWGNGISYCGEWKNDMFHGYGTYTWQDGTCYTGDWAEDRIEGKGVMTFPDGEYYDGEWKNDCFHGVGTYLWADGTSYSGDWVEDRIEGKGVMSFPDGAFYDGEWKDDLFCGFGTYAWANGNVYTGNWKDDTMHGKGKMVYADGRVEEGFWQNGEFVG